MQKYLDSQSAHLELVHLSSFYEKKAKFLHAQSSSPLKSVATYGRLFASLMASRGTPSDTSSLDSPSYEPCTEEGKRCTYVSNTKATSEVPLTQSQFDIIPSILDMKKTGHELSSVFGAHLPPFRTAIQTKDSYRCKECQCLLIRPEPKALAPKFQVRLLANQTVPRLCVISKQATSTQIRFELQITNPADNDILINLSRFSLEPIENAEDLPISVDSIAFSCSEFRMHAKPDFEFDEFEQFLQPSEGVVIDRNFATLSAICQLESSTDCSGIPLVMEWSKIDESGDGVGKGARVIVVLLK